MGALEATRPLRYAAGTETLWIRFKVGTFLPHLPATDTLNREITLPEGNGDNFWLEGGFCLPDRRVCRFFTKIEPDPPIIGSLTSVMALLPNAQRGIQIGYQRLKENLTGNGDAIYGIEIRGFSLLDLGFANSIKVRVTHQT